MSYQKIVGSLCAKMSAGYNGQDAYNDMLIVEERNESLLGWNTNSRNINCKECRGGAKNAR